MHVPVDERHALTGFSGRGTLCISNTNCGQTAMKIHPSSQNIKVAADAAIFTVRNGQLMVLLIQMKKKPHAGKWALPGGLIGDRETAERAARRILSAQTGVADAYLEQLATFDDPKRDPLGRVVSVAYFALIPSESVILRTTEKYADVRWWPM